MGSRYDIFGNVAQKPLKLMEQSKSTQIRLHKTWKTNYFIQKLFLLNISQINKSTPSLEILRRMINLNSMKSNFLFSLFFFFCFFLLINIRTYKLKIIVTFHLTNHSFTTNLKTPTLIFCAPTHIIMMNNAPLILWLG